MNMFSKKLIVALLATSFSYVSAHTNKNFLSVTRPQHASLLLDSALTRDLDNAEGHDRFGGNFLVSGYYSESNNGDALGRYFGINDKSAFKAEWVDSASYKNVALDAGFLVHDTDSSNKAVSTESAMINLSPKTISYGIEFVYAQDLSKIAQGLHIAIALPVERVENDMRLSITDPTAATANATTATVVSSLQKYLSGNLEVEANGTGPVTAIANKGSQLKLNKAIFGGNQGATGIADIDVVLGYDFVKTENWRFEMNLGLVIPTGNTATGTYIFEPLYGNGGHWELGFGTRVDGRLWHSRDQRINMHLGADYRYGFQADETRTVSGAENWAQYALLGKVGTTIVSQQFVPAANYATKDISVTPNSALRGNIGLEYGNGGFLIGMAYAPAWKEKESISHGDLVTDNAYAVIAPEQDTSDGAALAVGVFGAHTGPGVTNAVINNDVFARPSQLAHRVNFEVGYTFKEWEYPVTLGAGVNYEFASDNSVAETWGINFTAGIGF